MEKIAFDIGSAFGSPIGSGTRTIGGMVSFVVNAAIVVAGVAMLFLFAFGGISIIAGAGQSNPESVGKGKKAVTAALIGFIIIFTSYWIVRLIEVIFGYNFISDSPI